jgi:hypothetical protein
MSNCEGCVHLKNSNTSDGFAYCSQCDRAYAGADSGLHPDKYEIEKTND